VLIRCLLFFVFVFTYTNSFAKSDIYKKSDVATLHSELQNDFPASRTRKLQSIQRPIGSRRFVQKISKCNGYICGIKRFKNKLHRKFTGSFKAVTSVLSQKADYWGLKFKYLKLDLSKSVQRIIRRDKSSRNILPVVGNGNLSITTTGSGSRPIIRLQTSGGGISDPDGAVERVVWDFGDGTIMEIPASELNSKASVMHVYPEPAHYNVSLKVYDNDGEYTEVFGYAEIANNGAPVPTMTVDTNAGSAPLTVTFSSTAKDPEGHLKSHEIYIEDLDDGYYSETFEPFEFEFQDPGTYLVEYNVRDINNVVSTSTFTIFVDDPPPIGGSDPSPIVDTSGVVGPAPFLVEFNGGNSYDIDGTIATYKWDFDDQNSLDNFSDLSNPTHIYKIPGTYNVRLTVTDSHDRSSTLNIRVYVEAATVLPSQIVAFQWNNSDPTISFDGSPVNMRSTGYKYFWDFGDSETGDDPFYDHSYGSPGSYDVTLVTHDIHGVRDIATKTIVVGTGADSPEARLRSDGDTFGLYETIELDGSNSSDPGENDPLTYTWDFGNADQIVGADEEDYSYADTALYDVQLLVTNTRGISDRSQIFIFVIDGSTPRPNMQYSPKVGPAPLTVNFSGEGSFSEGSTITSYKWRIYDDGSKIFDTPNIEYTFEEPGEYYVEFFITDAAGNTRARSEPVIVYDSGSVPPGNMAPVASYTYSIDPGNPLRIEMDGSGSSDADDDTMIFEWKVNGQDIAVGDYADYKFPYNNIYELQLKVTDQWGAYSTDTKQIDVAGSAAQQIVFEYSPIKPVAGQSVQFGANNTYIPGSTIASYAWDFGDSSSGTGVAPTHTYSSAGTYTVELSVTDSNSHIFTMTKDIVVESVLSSPTLKLSIRDNDFLTEVSNGGTFTGTSFPETVHLSLLATSNSNTFIKNAVWDLGNGETAYGSDISYTYTKPGTYNLSVTGYDTNDANAVATATIVIPADCKRLEGETGCVSWVGINNNVLPLSAASWVLQYSAPFSSEMKHFPEGWISLIALDGSEDSIDISSFATVSSDQVTISRASLVQKNINLNRGYRLVLHSVDNTGAPIYAEWPILHFGAGTLKIEVSEASQLIVTNPSAQYKKFLNVGSGSVFLKDLPLGATSVIADKGDTSTYRNVTLKINQLNAVNIDFSAKSIRSLASKNIKKPNPLVYLKAQNELATKNDKVNLKGARTVWPASLLSICGEEPPFNPTKERTLSENQAPTWNFNSANPSDQSTFRDIPYAMSKPVRLSCAVLTDSLTYGFNRWKYKDGPGRCNDDSNPHWYWNEYLRKQNFDDSVITVKYEIQDNWTSNKFSNHLVFSATDIRRRQGRELTEVTQRVGLPLDSGDWSYRQNFELIVPAHFKRPQIRFELDSEINEADDNIYFVSCDVINSDNQPKAIKLSPVSFNPTSERKARNAQFSLQNRYKYFPVHYNNSSTSAVDIDPDSAKATYEIAIQYYNQSTIDWTGVDVKYEYDGTEKTISYSFAGAGTNDTVKGIYKNYFDVNTSELAGEFNWTSGVDRLRMTVTPKGTDSNSAAVSGLSLTEDYIALFDAKTIESAQSVTLCPRGYFGDNHSTFAQDLLIRSLYSLASEDVGLRCGNMALPFGGVFDLAGLSQDTHKHGLMVQVRTFNSTDIIQDAYDASNADARKADIDAYMTFSAAALAISEISTETDGMSNPTAKKKLYDFCHPGSGDPKFPCNEDTLFADLDHDMVLKICQWYSVSGTEIDGCPTGFLSNVVNYSNWVKQNVEDLFKIKNLVMAQPLIASGAQFDTAIYKDYHSDSLVKGVWPDGKPIWAVSLSETELNSERIAQCHENESGCSRLSDSMLNGSKVLGSMDVLAGWKW
jgi:PKD repeat protein